MVIFWICKTAENSQYNKKIEYLSEPSLDLIDKFKKEIIDCEDLTTHKAYVPCDHIDKNKTYMLFILDSRVEIMVRPDKENKKLIFTDCNENQ